jgi:hypothetical protein
MVLVTRIWGKVMDAHKLRNVKHELFCQMIVAGAPRGEAYQKSGFQGKTEHANTYGTMLLAKPEIKKRIEQLLQNSASRAEISRKQILERIMEDWDSSRRLGQMSSALKAAELMGKELHKMFVERKEVGGPGDFDSKTEDELKEIVREGLKELGWDDPGPNSLN